MEAPTATRRAPALGHALFGLATVALAAAGSAYAWLWMFSNFQLYDDEGYFLVLVRHLLEGRRVYDDVTTVYGPAWLAYRWVLNGILGAPLTTDGVRFESLAAWIVCALLAGVLARQATRGQRLARWFALAAAALALSHLGVFANEPGHPQDFTQLSLLGGLALALALRERKPFAAALVLGLAAGAQGFTKANLGIFLVLPVLLLLLANDMRRSLRAASWAVLAAALALPWLLMRAHFAQPWAPALAAVADASLLGCFLFARAEPVRDRRRELLGFGAGMALVGLASVGFALACGSTLPGLWNALVVLPSRFTSVIVIGVRVPGSALYVAPFALLLAGLALRFAARMPALVVPLAEFAFGTFALSAVGPHPEWLIPFVLPFAWIVLVPARTRAARLPLVACAALQCLQVFPVSGSQEALGTILLVPLGAIAVADACSALADSGGARRALAALAAGLLVLHAGAMPGLRARSLAAHWDGFERVALPGVRWTRFEESTGARARFLADTLRGSCDGFLSVRGDNSQYSWSGLAPATGVIVSHSWLLFDARQQAELAAFAERAPHALLLDNRNPERIPPKWRELPFFRVLAQQYQPFARQGADELCVRRGTSVPRLESCVVLPEGTPLVPGALVELRWPRAPVEGTELARVQIANLGSQALFADSAEGDARVQPRLFDGSELLFDGRALPRVALERLARASDLRLELPQALPPEQASFCWMRCFGPDGRRLLSLPVVVTARGP